MSGTVTRIAMWSGPRNISTAMMYSFAARSDTAVWDEPFYAYYLVASGLDHPMREAVIAAGEPDFSKVAEACVNGAPDGAGVFYQKQMTHHMLADAPREWMHRLTNAFLIRAPERVMASYAKKRDEATLADIGFVQQSEIFDRVADRLGSAPPVVDADDVLAGPEPVLKALCGRLGLRFDPCMLSWQPGPKPYDGAWAPHWYNAAWQSTGFSAPSTEPVVLEGSHARIAEEARPHYERLKRHRING